MPWYKVDTFPAFKRLFAHPTTPQVVESDSASEMMDPVIEGPTPKPINPQLSCPLFTRIPGEIRNSIFELALTSFDDKQRPYKKSAYYYRPDHRYAQKIDTNLLLTCRRIHAETETIPACINEIVNWCHRSPPDALTMSSYMGNEPGAVRRCQQSANLHLFRQQCCLEGHFKYLTPKLKHFPNITRLKITLRHTDWWYWETGVPIDLEPKRCGRPSACNPKARPSDPFERHSWGYQFSKINRLKEFHLELETVEQKKNELDAIVARASGWELPLGDGNVLVLSSNKTIRTGWVGHPLGRKEEEKEFDRADDADETYIDPGTADQVAEGHIEDISQNVAAGAPELEQSADSQRAEALSTLEPPPKPPSAKQRLVADSVRFIDEHLEPSVEDDSQRMTYYVVTLTWNATAAIHQDDR